MDNLPNNKEYECSHCDGTGITYIYSKDGVINMPCPECTDLMSHIRNWDWKGQMFDG
jgi:hypothetical protein